MKMVPISPEHIGQILSKSFAEKFWGKVDLKSNSECWNWKGRSNKLGGYGFTDLAGGRAVMCHRISMIIKTGFDTPAGMEVLHSCVGNKMCVNPNHLRYGSHFENMRECVSQGRNKAFPGSLNPSSKLSELDVVEIRNLYASGFGTQKSIGKMFGVSQTLIYYIVNRMAWASV